MAALGIETGGDLRDKSLAFLRENFGSLADYLYRAARGIDLRQVKADRPRKSVGGERTFERDISSGSTLRGTLEAIIEIVWERIERSGSVGRTVTLKLKFNDFTPLTRARSLPRAVSGKAEFAELARALLDQQLPLPKPVRLMGLTLSALEGAALEGGEPEHTSDDTAQLASQAELPF
jgi:DNA polymerase-4